ncbi:DUF2768 family protein [Cohnella sp.]|uniref:DUF2768 family protein n=1 Tax=Cohnella sp. TaxID=1883426 RepID=UPI0035624B58
MYTMLQLFAAAKLDAMDKMWVSFIGIGLMVLAALIITFARKTKGWIRLVLTIVAIVLLIYGIVCGMLAIV